jgi:hypothetical protein
MIGEQGAHMHIHATQPNPYAALDALRSAQKTAAQREAEMVRKELMESASELAGEAEDSCVIHVESRQESQRRSKRRNKKNQRNSEQQNSERHADKQGSEQNNDNSEEAESHLSDWA